MEAGLGERGLEVEPVPFDEVGVYTGPGVDEVLRVVDVRVGVAVVLEAVVGMEAVRLDNCPRGDVFFDNRNDALDISPLDDLQDDAAPLLLADDAEDPDALAPLAAVVLALPDLSLVDLVARRVSLAT